VFEALRWQRLPAFRKLGALLVRHLDGILSYCRDKVPFGKVEAINGNIRAMLRRGSGYRDHEYLLLKVQKATATRRLRAACGGAARGGSRVRGPGKVALYRSTARAPERGVRKPHRFARAAPRGAGGRAATPESPRRLARTRY
jgi:hypothetical protein